MSELDYRICRIIKLFNEEHKVNPTINDIGKVLNYSLPGIRYHLEKLIKLKIIEKKDRKYYLLVDNVR